MFSPPLAGKDCLQVSNMSISLYIHYPFCNHICDYCDFYRTRYDTDLETEYFKALKTELTIVKNSFKPEERLLNTIYIGGGTPSLANLKKLESFLSALSNSFRFARDLEFSFEINPESIDKDKLGSLKNFGVNRPIFGIQGFNMKILNTLKRKHKLKDSYRAIYLARALGFENFGIEMIYGLPRQTGRNLSDDLNQLMELSPPHISYRRLIVEKNTPFYKKVKNKKLRMPNGNLTAAMYHAINVELIKHNYFRYEISSWSMPGFECRHNFSYWEGGEYLGLGPSAHSYTDNHRMANSADLKSYFGKLKNNQRPLTFDKTDKESRIIETIMLGFRTINGISRASFRKQFGMKIDEALNGDAYQILLKGGFIKSTKTAIKLTDNGFPVADEIIKRLVK